MSKSGYIFVSIDYKNRQVKISAVSNVVSFYKMMKSRYPEYEIINNGFPTKFETRLQQQIMRLLEPFRCGTKGEVKTYSLDSYRVRTVIRLLSNDTTATMGHDELICAHCGESFEGDYSMIKDIYKFVKIDLLYCSNECMSSNKAKDSYSSQRYCKCGVIFNPTHKLDFYCKDCQK